MFVFNINTAAKYSLLKEGMSQNVKVVLIEDDETPATRQEVLNSHEISVIDQLISHTDVFHTQN